MRLERCPTQGAGYSVCLKADRTPVQVFVTNGPRQFSTHGTVITISVEALFQPTWSESRAGLRTKLQPTTAIYADSSSVVQHLLGPDLLERSWKNRSDGGDMSNPVCVSNGVPAAPSRPSHKSFFSKRWSMRWFFFRGCVFVCFVDCIYNARKMTSNLQSYLSQMRHQDQMYHGT